MRAFVAPTMLRADCSIAPASYCEGQARPRTKANDKAAKEKGEAAPAEAAGRTAQRALLKSAVARLAPQRKGVTDLYTIGVAGWADQDVFIKELDGALASLTKVLPIDNRVVRLVNHTDTMTTLPLASRDNIAAAVRAVGQVMDKNEDVLILFMTSHGTRDGFVAAIAGTAAGRACAPRELAKILDSAGILNRLVIVSACYSGIFVPPLANDNTIVMTAADAKNPSFGCAPGREWTFFGDALFNRSLRPGVGLAARLQRRTHHDQRVGTDGTLDAVQSAGAFRAGADREARAGVRRNRRRALAVESQQVVPRQTESADGDVIIDARVRSVPIVAVEPRR